MKIYLKKITLAAATGLMLSCVPMKKYQKLEKSITYKEKELHKLRFELEKQNAVNKEHKDSLSVFAKQL